MKKLFYTILAVVAISSCHKSSTTVTPKGITPAVWHLTDAPESFSYTADSIQLLNAQKFAYQRINGDTIMLIGEPQYYVMHIYADGDSMHVCNRFSSQENWEYTYPGFTCYKVNQ